MSLIQEKSEQYRQELRANSAHAEALSQLGKVKYHKAGGIKQHQVVRADQSRNYAGGVNIAGTLKAEADYIFKHEYLPLLEKTRIAREKRVTMGWSNGFKTPRKVQAQIDDILKRIAVLKKTANDITNDVADHHYVINQKLVKA